MTNTILLPSKEEVLDKIKKTESGIELLKKCYIVVFHDPHNVFCKRYLKGLNPVNDIKKAKIYYNYDDAQKNMYKFFNKNKFWYDYELNIEYCFEIIKCYHDEQNRVIYDDKGNAIKYILN